MSDEQKPEWTSPISEKLTEAGWEICSHTTRHLPLASYKFIEDAEVEDTEIHASGYRHGHLEGLTVKITDGDRSVPREIAGLGEESGGNRPIKLEHPFGESFAVSEQ